VCVYRSLDQDAFLQQLIGADVLLGNSSCGIIEAASAGTPAINVGPRQNGRERDTGAVADAADTLQAITRALRQALRLGPITLRRSIYGSGRAGRKVAEVLQRVPRDAAFLRKRNAY